MTGNSEFQRALDVSRETIARLEQYQALIERWNPAINLVSKSTLPNLWTRHFLDSAQVFELGQNADHWVDLGTGGGFPGLVVAILALEKTPEMKITCVESDLRKATFLRTAIRELGLQASVISKRIADVSPLEADVISARALAPLPLLLELAVPHLKPQGVALFPKGAEFENELKQALETWSFGHDTYQSKTDPNAKILKLGEIQRV